MGVTFFRLLPPWWLGLSVAVTFGLTWCFLCPSTFGGRLYMIILIFHKATAQHMWLMVFEFFLWYTFGMRLQAPWGFINNYPACDGFVDFVVLGVDARTSMASKSRSIRCSRVTKNDVGPFVVHMFLCTHRRWVVFDKNMVQMIGRFRSSSQYSTCPPMSSYYLWGKPCLFKDGFVPFFVHLIAPTLSSSL